jgi:hypothetical protein
MVVGDDIRIGEIPSIVGKTTVGRFCGKVVSNGRFGGLVVD